jgi:hypothetical protein
MDSDWTEIWDESSQRYYYYNTVTQLTTWDKPSIIVSIDNDSYNNNDIHRDNNSSNSADGSNDVIESLAWIELYDQDSKKYYYYSKDTNETTWIKPYETASKQQSITTATATIAMSSSSSAAAATAAAVVVVGIHPQQQQQKSGQQPYNEKNNDVNWHEVMTEDGRIYYYNENTQETSWTIPIHDDVKCSGSSSSSHNKYNSNGENTDNIATDTDKNKKNKKKKKKKDSSKESNLMINTDENDLDHHHGHNDDDNHNDWQEMVDKDTGMHYFANLLTGVTQWENPWGVNTSINDNYICGSSSSNNSRDRSSSSSGSGSGGSYNNKRSGNHNNDEDGDENDNNNQNNLSLYDGDELNLLSPLKVPSTTIANKHNSNSNDHATTTYSTSESNIKNKGSSSSSINSNGGSNHHHQSYLSAPVDYSSSLFTKNDKIHLARMNSDSSSSSSSCGNNGHFTYNAIVSDDNDTHSINDNDNEAIHAIQYDDNDNNNNNNNNNVKNNELTMLYQAILDGINSNSSSTTITAVKASDLIISIPINAYRAQNNFLLHTLLKILNSPIPSSSTSSSTTSSSMFRLEKYAELNFQYDRRNIHHNSSSSSASNIHPYERMLSYQSDVLKSSLTILSSPSLTNDAIQCFRYILSFIDHTAKVVNNNNYINAVRDDITNFIPTFNNIIISGSANNYNDNNNTAAADDFRSNNTDSNISNRDSIDIQKIDIVLNLLYKLVNSSSIELHDEIYCQLCKQSIKNPHIESVELIWQLFIIILATIPPSKSILPYLLNHISSSLNNIQMKITAATTTSISSSSSPPVTTPYDNIKRFIQSSLYHILPSAYATHRHEVPSIEEIRSLLLNGSMDVMIYTLERCDLCYYKCHQLTITSYTTIEEILLMICRKLSIHHNNSNIFALYECCMESEELSSLSQTSSSSSSLLLSSSNEKILPAQDRILDWIARQQRRHNTIMNRNDQSNSSSYSSGCGGGNDTQGDGN